MSDINKLPKAVPSTQEPFIVDVVGSVTGQRFVGEFVCKIPTIRDQGLIAKHEAVLNGDMASYLNPGILKIHRQIAYLRYTISEAPAFWKKSDLGYTLRDPNVVEAVYDEVIAFEDRWLKAIWGESHNESDAEKEA